MEWQNLEEFIRYFFKDDDVFTQTALDQVLDKIKTEFDHRYS